ncbi:MAG: 50S ribosomal protein L32 [Spirochaetes bacterium GWF1_51_8]|nr:MAG: 50S ribosomal protein L32 [Spirochaetes bacterium GWF1_51_8]
MAMPKHKIGKTKTRIRKSIAYYGIAKTPAMSLCPHCGEKKMPHRVCPHCGFYGSKTGGVQVITKAVKEAKE